MSLTLRLQIAQSRSYVCTLGPKVGILYILGAPGLGLDNCFGPFGKILPLPRELLWKASAESGAGRADRIRKEIQDPG